ncbi:MAG TPA: hypothetical protein VMZ53_32390 [Kofleriaceae bacterium]|nr:hypothetical protein [Kofleriaceae bacterium]
MSTRSDLMLWAQRVIARKAGPAHEIMEVPADATPDQAQAAFHRIARTAHPDLHRKGLTAEELEMVTSAYAVVAGAYQTLRTQTMQTTRMKPVKPDDLAAVNAPVVGRSGQTPPAGSPVARPGSPSVPPASRLTQGPARPTQPPPVAHVPATPAGPAPAGNASQSMSPKALVYYRKAELSLKRGDLKGAVLQLKLAIAADPASGFLRTALAEVELEVRKGT